MIKHTNITLADAEPVSGIELAGFLITGSKVLLGSLAMFVESFDFKQKFSSAYDILNSSYASSGIAM